MCSTHSRSRTLVHTHTHVHTHICIYAHNMRTCCHHRQQLQPSLIAAATMAVAACYRQPSAQAPHPAPHLPWTASNDSSTLSTLPTPSCSPTHADTAVASASAAAADAGRRCRPWGSVCTIPSTARSGEACAQHPPLLDHSKQQQQQQQREGIKGERHRLTYFLACMHNG